MDLKPDLVSISAGGNDLIRPGGDPDALAENSHDLAAHTLSSWAGPPWFCSTAAHRSSVLGRIRSNSPL